MGESQVTANQLAQQKEAELRQREAATKDVAKARQRMVSEEQYGQLVEGENLNREDDTVEARSVTEAISALELSDNAPGDAHPEKCACCLLCIGSAIERHQQGCLSAMLYVFMRNLLGRDLR